MKQTTKRAGVQGLISLIVVIGVLLTTVFFSLPSNVLNTRDGSKVRTISVSLAQQSWVFFTKAPSYNEFEPFSINSDNKISSLLKFPQTNPKNYFGLRRSQRAQGPEMANLLSAVTLTDRDISCSDLISIPACAKKLAETGELVEIPNTSNVPTICGPSILVESEPVRWSFRNQYETERLPVRAVAIDAKCEVAP